MLLLFWKESVPAVVATPRRPGGWVDDQREPTWKRQPDRRAEIRRELEEARDGRRKARPAAVRRVKAVVERAEIDALEAGAIAQAQRFAAMRAAIGNRIEQIERALAIMAEVDRLEAQRLAAAQEEELMIILALAA